MNAVFADTFYWIALTNIKDLAHEQAQSMSPDALCTTEEVLTEYLNYFAAWGPNFRLKASMNVHTVRETRTVQIVPQTLSRFPSACCSTRRVSTKVIA
jgi:uncharacterized protein